MTATSAPPRCYLPEAGHNARLADLAAEQAEALAFLQHRVEDRIELPRIVRHFLDSIPDLDDMQAEDVAASVRRAVERVEDVIRVAATHPRECPHCGGPSTPDRGKGPHWARLICRECGSFLSWLGKPKPRRKGAA